MPILDMNITFSDNIALLTKALSGCNDADIEKAVQADAAYMASTGNPLDNDHITILRAAGYGLIEDEDQIALWKLYGENCQQRQQALDADEHQGSDSIGEMDLMALVSDKLREAIKSTKNANRTVSRTIKKLEGN